MSSLLRRVVYPAMSRAGIFSGRVGEGEVAVLTYHGVLPPGCEPDNSPVASALVSAGQLRRQLRFLKSRYHLISPEQFHEWLRDGAELPKRALLLTCDDGLLNVLTEMIPVLLEEQARCLFFVTGASVEDEAECLWYDDLYYDLQRARKDSPAAPGAAAGEDNRTGRESGDDWWNRVQELSALSAEDRKQSLAALHRERNVSDPERGTVQSHNGRRQRLLNRRELQHLESQGMTVGAHTLSHPLLTKMPLEAAEQEIRECKTRLESCLKKEVWALAYPFGHEGSAGVREMTIAEKAGYACAFLNCGGGPARLTSPRFGLPRAHVTAHMNLAEMEAHLSGFHKALQQWFRGSSVEGSVCA